VLPATAVVGVTFSATMTLRNQSTPPNDTESVRVPSLFITPSCASAISPICLPLDRDPGVFDIQSAEGDPGSTTCAGIAFSIGIQDPATGEVQLIPRQTITLGPSIGPLGARTCQIDLLLVARKLPANPVDPSSGTTIALGRAVLEGVTSILKSLTTSTSEITVSAAPPSSTPVPTLSEWVMTMLAGVLVLVGAIALRRRMT